MLEQNNYDNAPFQTVVSEFSPPKKSKKPFATQSHWAIQLRNPSYSHMKPMHTLDSS